MLKRAAKPFYGVYVFGAAAVAAGVANLVWGDFATNWQPIQTFGDHVPGRHIFAYATALAMVIGGAALFRRRSQRAAALTLCVVYGIFAIFWLPRFYSVPHLLGFHLPLMIGISAAFAQQLILVAAAAIVCASSTSRNPVVQGKMIVARLVFGICVLPFGVAHFTGIAVVAALVPKWIFLGGPFWAIVTGVCFVLAGLAILSGVLPLLAARLLTLMLIVFSAVIWAPRAFQFPSDHSTWAGNAFNLAAIGSAWILADAIQHRREAIQQIEPGSRRGAAS